MAWENPKTNWGQAGQTVPGVADFNRIEENIRILGEYKRAPGYGTATGTNAKTITLDPSPTSYYDGLCFAFKNNEQNTGPVTINVNGLGARPIKKPNGNDIAAGNLKAGSIYTVRYNGTNFILQGEGGEYGTAQASDVLTGKTIGTENGIVTGTMPNHGSKTFTPNDTTQTSGAGYYSVVTVNPRPTLSGNATPDQVLAGRTFYNDSYTKRTGTLVMPIPYSSVWTQRTSSFGTTTIYSVTYGNNMFVAVGGSGKLATSADGITWTQRTSSFGSSGIYSVTYGNNMFVAVGGSGKLATSADGITWIQRTSSFDTSILRVGYGNNMFVAVGGSGKLATSVDGITWTQRISSFDTDTTIRGVAYGNNIFVAVGDSGKLATSTNGTTWTQRTSSFGSSGISSVAYGNNMFVAVGGDGKLATSTNGTTWTQRISSFDTTAIQGVAYVNDMFVAVSGSGKLATSVDGITWTQRTSSFDTDTIWGVAYGNNMFVAVGGSGKLATLS